MLEHGGELPGSVVPSTSPLAEESQLSEGVGEDTGGGGMGQPPSLDLADFLLCK